ncbi:hypothetical protein NEPAR06_0634 [Nematocida parisii]|uniref:Uncharacterized protein n=1 Tax=Nematocida parisii (strain ERTm3) TaxID=935791 RepID=I3EEX8_NEMP3|nr:uncharacterized protein NEPG_01955 [Nematocida parisii ERTm1]EIJ87775.1 hypothetical protein NEQG_01847 [Nematocida parisii ERTm3]KAI5127220.1 hypothetical protein NEPAR08_0817 [Nematocida parisii]EIJ93000.1 hypothetical protein NEPG_01955 [Nematocida parisii ERTm1]KAI5127283.1 hypothetical protein NEPAR03_0887 [Nematocida parisii]KAI5141391.1 hypothetical protein NEPAR04_0944 [Nematocida parisii]|eukprot:XP_013059783.1 hypothetical protein NEPG_01955 [Nematocida parisii ERTm1]
MKLIARTCRRKAFLYILLLGVLSSYYSSDIESVENKIANLAIYSVFLAPASWNSVIFQAYITKRSPKEAMSISKLVIENNIKQLKSMLKKTSSKKPFKHSLIDLFIKYKEVYLKDFSERDKLFESSINSGQAGDMQRKQIDNYLSLLNKLKKGEEKLLSSSIKKIIQITEDRSTKKEIFDAYNNVLEKTLNSMSTNTPVANTLKNTTQEFITKTKEQLLDIKTNKHNFNLERARFNLGGAIYTPGLLVEIAGKLTTSDKEKFVTDLVHSLLYPLIQLKEKVSGSSPESTKEEVIKYLQSVTNSIDVYFLKKEISSSQELRSESICKRTEEMLDKKKKSQKIDKIQIENTKRMVSTLEEANSSLFKDFVILDSNIISKYTEYIKTGGGDPKLKEEIELFFDLP